MPNHVLNYVRFTGPAEQVRQLMHNIAGTGHHPVIDFNHIVPQPEIIVADTAFCSEEQRYGVYHRCHLAWHFKHALDRVVYPRDWDCLTIDEQHALVTKACQKETGVSDWYHWRLRHWGTKWNAYWQDVVAENGISFATAWSCPYGILQAIAHHYPHITTLEP